MCNVLIYMDVQNGSTLTATHIVWGKTSKVFLLVLSSCILILSYGSYLQGRPERFDLEIQCRHQHTLCEYKHIFHCSTLILHIYHDLQGRSEHFDANSNSNFSKINSHLQTKESSFREALFRYVYGTLLRNNYCVCCSVWVWRILT